LGHELGSGMKSEKKSGCRRTHTRTGSLIGEKLRPEGFNK